MTQEELELQKQCYLFIYNNETMLRNIIQNCIKLETKRKETLPQQDFQVDMLSNEVVNLQKLESDFLDITKQFEISLEDIPF